MHRPLSCLLYLDFLQIPGYVHVPAEFLLHQIAQPAGSVGLAVNKIGDFRLVVEGV